MDLTYETPPTFFKCKSKFKGGMVLARKNTPTFNPSLKFW